MSGGRPSSGPPAAPTPEPVSIPAARAPRLAIGLLVAGALLFAYGLILQAPMSPSAVWSGVLDSAAILSSAAPQGFGRSTPTRAVSLHLRKVSSERIFRLPPAFSPVAESLKPEDTIQVILGWYSAADTATALRLVRNGTTLVDSAVVLQAQRRHRTRSALAGVLVMVLGIVGIMRRPG